jgi:protein-tyrosine phosphatase
VERFRFGPARHGESVVHGAQRPGYDSWSVDTSAVHEWIEFMLGRGIRRVCCLLPPDQLAYYHGDLLGEYRASFGDANVLHVPVEDFHLCDPALLEAKILPFLVESDSHATPVVVHCSGGSGRTGHVLAAWLARHRGLDVDTALAEVRSTGRDPGEAVGAGHATLADLTRLLRGT